MAEVEIVVRGRHVDVSSRFRELASEKLARVERFGQPIQRVDVELSKEQNPRLADRAFEVELTCRGKGPVIRAEASAADKYSALDLASGRLEERLRRAHDAPVSPLSEVLALARRRGLPRWHETDEWSDKPTIQV